jgi:hypothetical protein
MKSDSDYSPSDVADDVSEDEVVEYEEVDEDVEEEEESMKSNDVVMDRELDGIGRL